MKHACSVGILEAAATALRRSLMDAEQLTLAEVSTIEWWGWERTTITNTENDASGSGSGTNKNGSMLLLSLRHTGHLTTEWNCAWKSEYTMPDNDSEVPLFSNLCSPSWHTVLCLPDDSTCLTENFSIGKKNNKLNNLPKFETQL